MQEVTGMRCRFRMLRQRLRRFRPAVAGTERGRLAI